MTGVTTLSLPNGASPTVPAVASLQSADRVMRPEAEERESGDNHIIVVVTSPQNKPQKKLSKGAIAGIVIGVLAFVGLVAAAILVWRKYRRDGKLPFMRATRHRVADDESRGPSIGGPLPVRVGDRPPVKTNTQIMDDLMRAAYAAESGGGGGAANGMERGFAPGNKPPPPPPPAAQPKGPFMDEKAYAALVGPPSPGSPKKPVMRWLDGVRPPTQPNGPEFPPTPEMPASATMPRLPGGRDSRFSRQLRRLDAAFSDGSSVTSGWRPK